MSFGWSVGDIVAAIDVICKVVEALSEASGSAIKYQETDRWLKSVVTVLTRFRQAPQATYVTDINRILRAVSTFQRELSKEYGETLGPRSQSHWGRRIRRKVDMLLYRKTVESKVTALRGNVQASLDVISLSLGIDINNKGLDTNEAVHDILGMLEQIKNADGEDPVVEAVRWLDPVPATQKKFGERSKTNVGGSGQWLLHTEAYQQWLSTLNANGQTTKEQNVVNLEKRLLWITGIPGSGKTSLATSLVQEFKNRGKMYKTAFFYCETREQKTTSLHAILRTWTWQLMQQCRWDAEGLAEITEARKSESEPSESTLKQILVNILCREKDVVLVLDGLDECVKSERETFITWVLPSLLENASCAIFSRLSNDLVRLVDTKLPKMYRRLHISPEDTAEDMRKFSAREIGHLKETSTEMQKELMHAFERRANGMFLWVELMVRTLQDCLLDDYLSEIEQAPDQLNDVYRGILGDIWSRRTPQSARRHSKFLLQLLTCAARPLSLKEIDIAMQVTVDEPTFRYGKRNDSSNSNNESHLSLAKLLVFCGSLVTITDNSSNPIVALVHTSAREYLVDPGNRGEIFGDLIVDEQETHGLMARICLTYLCYDNVPAFPYEADLPPGEEACQNDLEPLQKTADAYLDRIPLQPYATTQWAWHVLAAENPLSRKTTASLLRLCRSEASTIRWAQTALFVLIDRASITGRGTQDDVTLLTPICERISDKQARDVYAAWLFHLTGDRAERTFSRWTRLMMPGEGDVFPSDVHVAAHFDFLDYLRNYLEAGGNPNRQTVTGNTPLHACAHCETLASAELLLKYGADPGVPGFAGIEAMAWGMGISPPNDIHTGRFSVAEVLLKAGADPFSARYNEHSAFCRAMGMALTDLPPYSDNRRRLVGDDPCVLDLLTKMTDTAQRKARVRQAVDSKQLLLQVVEKGSLPLAKFLLSCGVNVNLVYFEGTTALDIAQASKIDDVETLLRSFSGKTAAEINAGLDRDDEAGSRDKNDSLDKRYWPETADDVFRTYLILQTLLRAAPHSSSQSRSAVHGIIVHILDNSRYWLKLTASRDDLQEYDQCRSEYDPVYLTTPPLLGRQLQPVSSICFYIASRDQGWVSDANVRGGYDQSYTWFSFDILSADGSTKRTDKPISLTPNLCGIDQITKHRMVMSRDDSVYTNINSPNSKGSECLFVPRIQAGDRIAVYAKALYPGWVNHVESVRVVIYTTCLLYELKE